MPSLVAPEHVSRASFASAAAENRREGRYLSPFVPDDALSSDDGYAAWCSWLRDEEREDVAAARGLVPMTVYFWAEGDEFLGRLSIRHRLNDELERLGGHIGYDVRPSARRMGHATAMLNAALPFAASLGIDPALVTCDDTNVASRRVIEANGGVAAEPEGHKLRFWVPTARC